MMEKEALRVENACGRFLKLAVLDHFNFSANSGEICCLFGAHNAGKTVFMQLLAGKLAGEWSMRLLLDGVDVHWSPGNNPVAALFAFIWDESRLLPNFSVAENLCIFGQVPLWKLYIRKSNYESQTRHMLKQYGLSDFQRIVFSAYSAPIKRRETAVNLPESKPRIRHSA